MLKDRRKGFEPLLEQKDAGEVSSKELGREGGEQSSHQEHAD